MAPLDVLDVRPSHRPRRVARAHGPKALFALELLDNRYPSLHGLRVLAIVSVVQFHVTWIFAGEQGIRLDRDFTASSLTVFFGMDLFFILSGFLIGSILLRSLENERHAEPPALLHPARLPHVPVVLRGAHVPRAHDVAHRVAAHAPAVGVPLRHELPVAAAAPT